MLFFFWVWGWVGGGDEEDLEENRKPNGELNLTGYKLALEKLPKESVKTLPDLGYYYVYADPDLIKLKGKNIS